MQFHLLIHFIDYVIANELGGERAFQNLKDRAWARGIRMASDMVPNHMGIYSKWVVEKPDYFLQRNEPPYPNYSFTGQNLSEDDRVEVKIEDQYYSRKDAAVVFQRRDKYTGQQNIFIMEMMEQICRGMIQHSLIF